MNIDIDLFKILNNEQKAGIREIAAAKITEAMLNLEITANSLDISDIVLKELREAFDDNYIVNEEDMEKVSKAVATGIVKVIKTALK